MFPPTDKPVPYNNLCYPDHHALSTFGAGGSTNFTVFYSVVQPLPLSKLCGWTNQSANANHRTRHDHCRTQVMKTSFMGNAVCHFFTSSFSYHSNSRASRENLLASIYLRKCLCFGELSGGKTQGSDPDFLSRCCSYFA